MKYALVLFFDDGIEMSKKFNAPTNKEVCVQATRIANEYIANGSTPNNIGIVRCHGKKQQLIRIWCD